MIYQLIKQGKLFPDPSKMKVKNKINDEVLLSVKSWSAGAKG
jgi:hypothetical protein